MMMKSEMMKTQTMVMDAVPVELLKKTLPEMKGHTQLKITDLIVLLTDHHQVIQRPLEKSYEEIQGYIMMVLIKNLEMMEIKMIMMVAALLELSKIIIFVLEDQFLRPLLVLCVPTEKSQMETRMPEFLFEVMEKDFQTKSEMMEAT